MNFSLFFFPTSRHLHIGILYAYNSTGESLQLSSAEILYVPVSNLLKVKIIADPVLDLFLVLLVKHGLDRPLHCPWDLVNVLRLDARLLEDTVD